MSTAMLAKMIGPCVYTQPEGFQSRNGRSYSWVLDLRPLLLNGRSLKVVSKLLIANIPRRCQIAGLGVSGSLLVPAIVLATMEAGRSCSGLIIRERAKPYGRERQIEGDLTGDPVVIVDDIVNSGRTLFEAVAILREHGLQTSGVAAIIDFERVIVREWLEDEGISFNYLITLRELRRVVPALSRKRR